MTEPAAISALLSASAVVGALTTSQVVSLSLDVRQLHARVSSRSRDQKSDDVNTRGLQDALAEYEARWQALHIIAGLQWVVVTALLGTAGWLAYPRENGAWVGQLVPFFLATCALGVALVVLPVSVAVGTRRRLGETRGLLG
jgi:hypothetical protein